LLALRFVQGLGFAAAMPAELAAVADVVPPAQLGRAYGWVAGAQQGGFIFGPAIGGLLAVFGRWTVFAVTGFALFAAAIVVWRTLPRNVRSRLQTAPARLSVLGRDRVGAVLRSMILLSIGLGVLIGIYDVVWSLYM